MKLKVASMILFWFGIYAEFLGMVVFTITHYHHGTFDFTPFERYLERGPSYVVDFVYIISGHGIHIISGYWLSKGRKKGIILGFSLSLYEIVPFLVPNLSSNWLDPYGIGVRILFTFVIFLIITGRKELVQLRSDNWRPWKKPF